MRLNQWHLILISHMYGSSSCEKVKCWRPRERSREQSSQRLLVGEDCTGAQHEGHQRGWKGAEGAPRMERAMDQLSLLTGCAALAPRSYGGDNETPVYMLISVIMADEHRSVSELLSNPSLTLIIHLDIKEACFTLQQIVNLWNA